MAGHASQAARIMAAGRVLIGATMLAAPDLVAAPWVGEDARTPGARVIVRALGARDAVLGAGTLAAAGDRAQLRRWLIASSASDVADFVATLAGPRSSARSAVLAVAAAAAVTGLAAAASA
ncbi:MAG: hypothetical protein ACRDPA_32680 [Solirubrobacteraceae bacterium]